MRVLVVHAHPVETSYNRALFAAAVEALKEGGHEVDPLDLHAENFEAVMSLEERLAYHDVPENLTPAIMPYVDRLRAAEGLVFIHPVWNYGYPAILKGFFDRIFVPGVSFVLVGGKEKDKGQLVPNLKNVRKVAYVTTYGGDRLRTVLMGDPPRSLARRWGWAMFGTRLPPTYLALYDMNNASPERLEAFLGKVRRQMSRF
jgi:putative NADPH-quinone reductase